MGLPPIWTLWAGRRVKNVNTGEVFIETDAHNWQLRLGIWKRALNDGFDTCPCPMPAGHLMFSGESVTYQPLPDTMPKQQTLTFK